ncbi:MAG TPA: helix-turn-helix transcriptional regulator [Streptosporangiaceae bacterium]|jgi:transcriptional regulator with XRE-family HTH domain|nr:helix-turn-helix transcriptional regulator [Streptosporangiaceae bacterium]
MRTVRSRRLALELRQFRERAGLTGEQVAEEMGWSLAKVYRLEGDKVRILVRDVGRLLKLYKISGAQAEAVLELARQARVKDWWQQYSGAIPEWFQFYVGLEAAVSAMHGYDSELVPGLLQTEQYVRAIMSTAPIRDDNDETERQVTVRMERQKRLTAADAPLLWAVLNEGVIRRTVGGPQVMREQLRHLAEMSTLSNVTVQVLTFDAGAHSAMHGAFTIMKFPEPVDPDVVYVEAQTGALYLEKTEDVARYSLMFDYLRAQALSPEASRDLMTQLASTM